MQIRHHRRSGQHAVGGRCHQIVIAQAWTQIVTIFIVVALSIAHKNYLPIQHPGAAVVQAIAQRPVTFCFIPLPGKVDASQSGGLVSAVRLLNLAQGSFSHQTHSGHQ